MYFYSLKQMKYKEKRKGVFTKRIEGINSELIMSKLAKGFISKHSHNEEQIGFVTSGEIEIIINDESKICTEGDVYHIPPGAYHTFTVISADGAEVIDIFSPPKEENSL